jgi:hexosaminidase
MYRRLEKISIQLEELGLTHEKNYEMMLRRLANSRDISALKTLVDVLEPVEDYKRHGKGNILTSYGPYSWYQMLLIRMPT